MVIAFMTIALVSARADRPDASETPSPEGQAPASEVASKSETAARAIEETSVDPSPLISKDKTLGAAYFKTLSILSQANDCSHFFGGPAASVRVFKELIGRVEKHVFPSSVGIQMSGVPVNIRDSANSLEYRMFDKVSINANGPFYRRHTSLVTLPLLPIGGFSPNTHEARVLMLLHELGHMMKGEDGNWLLPNDGKDEYKSRLNSQKVEQVCGEQIKALRKHESKVDSQITAAPRMDH
jgi:hypothetical protein